MTINEIYIGAFGKLKDYSLTLDRGLNVIYGENENGKSTVMAFLKMMFYGSGRASQQLSKSPRKRYAPWDGSSMNGRVCFTHGGRNYCLEREFRTGDTTDRIILRDMDLGTREAVPSDVGARFFGLSAAAFERSVFIGQPGAAAQDAAANGELNSQLSNLALTGDEDTSYQLVCDRLTAAEQKLMTVRHAGAYDKGLVRLEELKTRLARAESAAAHRVELEERANLLKAQMVEAMTECDAVKRTVDSENDLRNAAKLREYLEAKRTLDGMSEALKTADGGKIDESFIGKVNFCISKYEFAQQRVTERADEVQRLEEEIRLGENAGGRFTPEGLADLQAQAERIRSERGALGEGIAERQDAVRAAEQHRDAACGRRRSFHPVLLPLGAGALAVGCVLLALSFFPVGGAAAAAGLLLAVLSLILRPADRKAAADAENALAAERVRLAELKTAEAELTERLNRLTEEIHLASVALNTDRALLEQRQTDLAARREALKEAEDAGAAALRDLLTLTERFTPQREIEAIRSELETLAYKAEELKQCKTRLRYLSDDLRGISYEQAAEKLEQIGEPTPSVAIDFEAAKAEFERLKKYGTDLSNEFSAVNAELQTAFTGAENPETIQTEIDALTAKLQSQKAFCEASALARRVLEDSFAEVRRGYGAVLEQKALGIFSRLTGGRYSGMAISNTLEPEAEQTGCFGMRSMEALSSGTADQGYFSLRLALSDLMSEGETLPVLLDDVFAQYDDRRTAEALVFLKEYCASRQAVLFTCHRAVCDAAAEAGVTPRRLTEQ